jgi:hypothetical protein
MKLKLKLDDPQTRAVWDTVQRAKEEVANWPAWKRGEETGSMVKLDATQASSTGPKR